MRAGYCYPLLVLASAALITGITGCAGRSHNHGIIVDTKGVDPSAYQRDLAECSQFAEQVNTGEKVAKDTVGGAVIGGAIGATVGNSDTAQRSAGAGAVLGASKGVGASAREKRTVIRNCLRGRGYRVLN